MPDTPKSEPETANAGGSPAGTPASARPGKPSRRRSSKPRRLIDTSGPEPGDSIEEVRLTVGRIGGPHGLNGEVKMVLLTDEPDHLLALEHLYLGNSDTPVSIAGIRFHAGAALLSLEGVDTPEDARKLGGLAVKIDGTDAKPLEEGEYFLYQLIGLRATTQDGNDVGVVVDLIETASHDVLVIAPDGSGTGAAKREDLLIPNHPVYVHEINPEEGVIVVTKPVYSDESSA